MRASLPATDVLLPWPSQTTSYTIMLAPGIAARRPTAGLPVRSRSSALSDGPRILPFGGAAGCGCPRDPLAGSAGGPPRRERERWTDRDSKRGRCRRGAPTRPPFGDLVEHCARYRPEWGDLLSGRCRQSNGTSLAAPATVPLYDVLELAAPRRVEGVWSCGSVRPLARRSRGVAEGRGLDDGGDSCPP